MKSYFYSIEKQNQLKAELNGWLGTPFRHHCSVKNRGCDCIGFVTGVLINVDFLKADKFVLPDYSQDWHIHNNENLLIKGLRGQDYLQEIPSFPEFGDILVFKYGKVSSHVGIYADGTIYHAITNRTVIRTPFKDPNFQKRITNIFRCVYKEAAK